MADVVIVLGAGASRASGAPLMREFFDRAKDLLVDHARRLRPGRSEAFKAVFEIRRELQAIHSKTWLDLGNIEEVFALLEMQALLEPSGENEEKVRNLETLIAATLELTVGFHVANIQSAPEASDDYRGLRKLVARLVERGKSVAFLSFNYDLALEQVLGRPLGENEAIPFAYWLKPAAERVIPLLKLHGSMNWFRCQYCKDVVPVVPEVGFDYEKAGADRVTIRLPAAWPRHAGPDGNPCVNQDTNLREAPPVLVPPTWNKHGRYREILPVWQRAVRELATASDIVVIGYSLPPTDVFFHHLVALGTLNSEPLRSFIVVNTDTSGGVEERFRDRLGRGVPFRYLATTFEKGLGEVGAAVIR